MALNSLSSLPLKVNWLGTVTFTNVPTNSLAITNVTVPGVVVGDRPMLVFTSVWNAGLILQQQPIVLATNTVSLPLYNASTVNISPVAQTNVVVRVY